MPTRRPIGTPRTTRLRKLECDNPACDNMAYKSRKNIARGLDRCCCGGELIPVDLDDAALVLDDARLASHPALVAEQEAFESAVSAALVKSRRGNGRILSMAARCGSCHRFKSRPSDVCGYCGDDPVRVGQDRRTFDREHGWDWGDRDTAGNVDLAAVAARVSARLETERREAATENRLRALRERAEASTDPIPF